MGDDYPPYTADELTGPTVHVRAEDLDWILGVLRCPNKPQAIRSFATDGVAKFYTASEAGRWYSPVEVRRVPPTSEDLSRG